MKEKTKYIQTERGLFHLVDTTPQELKEMGYGYHTTTHQGGDYDIYSNGTQAVAIKKQEPQRER